MGEQESSEFSYPELADARRLTGGETSLKEDLRELFRRMVFNILIDNTDDHERNHGLLYEDGWSFAPAFDISTQGTAIGYQGMLVGENGSEASLRNAVSECAHFGLTIEEASLLIEAIIERAKILLDIYRGAGVESDIASRTQSQLEDRVANFSAMRAELPKPKGRGRGSSSR